MNILAYCAVNPARRFPEAERLIWNLDGVRSWWFDDTDEPGRPWFDTVLRKYQNARRDCLALGYDALLTVESDMLVPYGAALRLMKAANALDVGVAYGLYAWRHGWALWNSYVALNESAGISLSDEVARECVPDEWAAARVGRAFQCYGVGLGCTLIRREVLETLDFRNFDDADSFYVDWLYAADCNARKIKQVCDPAVVCGHISDSGILYPDLTMPDLVRREN